MASLSHKLYLFGCKVSDRGANLAGHPAAIALVAIFCAIWFVRGGPNGVNTLTLILSVLAITLTQMVLNQQRRSEAALHMKIDELILSQRGARDELAGIEKKTEDELEQLRRDDVVTRGCDAVLEDPPRPSDAAAPAAKRMVVPHKTSRALRNGATGPKVARSKKGKVDADSDANGSGGSRRKRGAGRVRAG